MADKYYLMKNNNIDISVNVTGHNERDYLYRTLNSLLQSINYVKTSVKINIELNIGLDDADEQTKQVAKDFINKNKALTNLYVNSFGDLSQNRNFMFSKSKGTYIAFCDGDDFFSENYFLDAYKEAQKHKEPAAYAAGWVIIFNDQHGVMHFRSTKSSTSQDFILTNCYGENPYPSQLFVHRKIFEKYKYKPLGNIYAYEDWNWNMTVLSANYNFYSLPSVIHFYRNKPVGESLVKTQAVRGLVLESTPFLEPQNFKNYRHEYYQETMERSLVVSKPVVVTPVISIPTPPTEPVHQKAIPRIGKNILIKILRRKSKLYTFIALQYRSTQLFFAPILHLFRNNYLTRRILPVQKNAFKTLFSSAQESEKVVEVVKEEKPVSKTYLLNANYKRIYSLGFTKKHFELWKKLNKIEPAIRYSSDDLLNLKVQNGNYPGESKDYYFDFCNKYDRHITDVILLPSLKSYKNNAKISIRIKELSSMGRKVLVLGTENSDQRKTEIKHIPNVIFLERSSDFSKLSEHDFTNLVIRLLQNWPIKSLSVIDSRFGYSLIDKYSEILHKKVKIIIYNFIFTREGMSTNDSVLPVGSVFDKTDLFIVDNQKRKRDLTTTYGIPDKKIVTISEKSRTDAYYKKIYQK
jgi:hypothetical protein